MQADVKKRRPVCFYRHFPQCFSRFQALELSSDRHLFSPSSDDLPSICTNPVPKLSRFSESPGKRGYTEVSIGSRVGNEHRNSIFFASSDRN